LAYNAVRLLYNYFQDGGSAGNMVTNTYAKSNYDRLRINKALGIIRNQQQEEEQEQQLL